MTPRSTEIDDLVSDLLELERKGAVAKADHVEDLLEPFTRLRLRHYKNDLGAFETFLPPRLIRSAKAGTCIPFFGAGVSADADVPLWWDLLSRLGVSWDLVSEPELEHDPLTAAEVLAYQIGMPRLDEALRDSIRGAATPALAHFLLASLYQDIYVTTNYDCLFEVAWEKLHGVVPRVVTTDGDLASIDPADGKDSGKPIVFKLHGSVDKESEELILTRSQYRRHYRTNREMFECVRSCLARSNTLFVGFGHRDPEITRLVEDVIHAFEMRSGGDSARPAFYSLQFNMGERTPEIFAARGIVALRPPISFASSEEIDPRTVALTASLIDILGAVDSDAHQVLDLDLDLSRVLEQLEAEVHGGIEVLTTLASRIAAGSSVGEDDLAVAGAELGSLAGQGVYLLDAGDDISACWLPDELSTEARRTADLKRRPYVKQSRMYREPFAASTTGSVFNGNGTSFLCVPILGSEHEYRGLLFSAFQAGAWETPLRLQQEVRKAHTGGDVSFLLVDSEGVLLVPPNEEFGTRQALVPGEPGGANIGFDFERLRRLSRRDRLVERIWNNIVPLARDDDVLELGDVKVYSVVAEVAQTRWKLAISIPAAG